MCHAHATFLDAHVTSSKYATEALLISDNNSFPQTAATLFYFSTKNESIKHAGNNRIVLFGTAGDKMYELYSRAYNYLLSNSLHLFFQSISMSQSHFFFKAHV